jgi:3-methyladenine DNA glycosylase/8-oxoguanine DNA glycosylase
VTGAAAHADPTLFDGAEVVGALAAHHLGVGDPTFRVQGSQVWRTTTTPEGPATVCFTAARGGVRIAAWGPGRAWALEQAPAMAGADDDPGFFDPSGHRLVWELARRRPHLRIGRTGRVVDALIPTILGQKVTGLESRRSWRALVHAHGEHAPGPHDVVPAGLRVPPEPERLRRLGYAAFHGFGIERRRAEAILGVCHRATSLERLGRAYADRPDELVRRLCTLPGIGPWTATITAGIALGDPDAVPVGDYNLPHHVSWTLVGERRADDARMLELLSPYAGHRARVIRLLTALPGPPRRAPRATVRSWARW